MHDGWISLAERFSPTGPTGYACLEPGCVIDFPDEQALRGHVMSEHDGTVGPGVHQRIPTGAYPCRAPECDLVFERGQGRAAHERYQHPDVAKQVQVSASDRAKVHRPRPLKPASEPPEKPFVPVPLALPNQLVPENVEILHARFSGPVSVGFLAGVFGETAVISTNGHGTIDVRKTVTA